MKNKIRCKLQAWVWLQVLDPQSNTIRSWLGTGRPGFKDGSRAEAQLSEPGGLAPGPDNTIFVADTNNSLIRCHPSTRPSSGRCSAAWRGRCGYTCACSA